MSHRKYFVTYGNQQREVFPFGEDALKYQWVRDPDLIFKRKKLQGTMIFINDPSRGIDDFDFFKAIELTGGCCSEIKIGVRVDCDGGGHRPEWKGYFTTWMGKFDFDRCRFEVTPDPDDIYRCIMEKWDTVFNLFSFPIITTTPIGNYVTQEGDTIGECCDMIAPTADAATIYAWWDAGGYTSAADMLSDGWCVKEQNLTPYEAMWTFTVSAAAGFAECDALEFYNSIGQQIGTARLCRIVGDRWYINELEDMGGVPATDSSILTATFGTGGSQGHIENTAADNAIMTSYQLYPQPFSTIQTIWHREELTVPCVSGVCDTPPGGGWILVTPCGGGTCDYARCPIGEDVEYRGALWVDMMESIAKTLCPNIPQLTSIFFDKNPNTSDPKYSPGINYVTGTSSAVDQLIISHRTDVVDTSATNPAHAPAGNLTLKQMFQWAREEFNVYWDILPNGKLRMEHFSYFQATLSLDLTAAQYKPYVDKKNAYSHTREPIPSFEVFQWQDGQIGTLDFLGKNIVYDAGCTAPGQKVEHNPELLSTDLPYLTNNPDLSRSSEGFVMIATDIYLGDYIVESEIGVLSGNIMPNGHLSWANLHQNYHRWNRYLPSGEMNGTDTTFLSWRPNVKQVDITIPQCCVVPNPDGYFITELSDIIPAMGRVNTMEQAFKQDTLKLSLEYAIGCSS